MPRDDSCACPKVLERFGATGWGLAHDAPTPQEPARKGGDYRIPFSPLKGDFAHFPQGGETRRAIADRPVFDTIADRSEARERQNRQGRGSVGRSFPGGTVRKLPEVV
jgi:hypothetical protein